jgi:hypothetical protein
VKFVSGRAYVGYGVSSVQSATYVGGYVLKLPVTMRTLPTASFSSMRIYDGAAAPVTSIAADYSNTEFLSLDFGCSGGGLTTGRLGMVQSNNSATAYIAADCEL